MKRTMVSLAGVVVAVLALGLGAGAAEVTAHGTAGQHGTPAHVRLADGKSPTGTSTTAASDTTVTPAVAG
ncbi:MULTISPECIES: hypothetical protein [Streptacidiphilus]|uniref:Uncharacterized protein n=2 Tax=Streptacidiphilus TaxID=228398 RepID=A0ABV6UGX1_9ACTN|nr:hypothetical protein [Streptacidiphilus jeojiense]